MRTVYRGSTEDDACPVCSSPLVSSADDETEPDDSVVLTDAEEQVT
ncbi:MAG: hypothetical protein ACRDLB_10710 [Actinomycetota bacterium]